MKYSRDFSTEKHYTSFSCKKKEVIYKNSSAANANAAELFFFSYLPDGVL